MSYGEKFEEALLYAARLHRGQQRKGTDIPYVNHLLAVASIVGENGGTEDEVIAALLHDAIEDTPATREDLATRFGDGVAGIVEECSDADAFPKPSWRKRKEQYIEHLRHASPAARLVSAADKLHNARAILADLRSIGDALWDRFTGGRAGTLWYYRSLVEVLRETGQGPLVEELDRVVVEIENLAGSTPKTSPAT
ncbi:MAG: HD domain-containing protein [Rubrobacteraceae bacterium]